MTKDDRRRRVRSILVSDDLYQPHGLRDKFLRLAITGVDPMATPKERYRANRQVGELCMLLASYGQDELRSLLRLELGPGDHTGEAVAKAVCLIKDLLDIED